MEFFKILGEEAKAKELRFLVIGGHAINAHGYERQTADIDLLIRREDAKAWKHLFSAMGYETFSEQSAFIQLTPGNTGLWPVDLMSVNEETFEKMDGEAVFFEIGRSKMRIPCLDHLIALKLHALNNATERRKLKDFSDILALVEVNQVDVRGKKFQELCERYGTKKIHQQIIAASGS